MSAAVQINEMVEVVEPKTEGNLFRRALRDDDDAMKSLYAQHSKRLFLLGLRLTGSHADAEEVVQETFLKAWRHLSGFRGEAQVGTWLYRIALNSCRDRAKKKQWNSEQSEPAETAAEPDAFARKRLENALGQLSTGYREVLVMHDVLEMNHGEIAQTLDIAVGTSKSQLHKARAQMRGLLKKTGVGRPSREEQR